jgi:hypothetical protein
MTNSEKQLRLARKWSEERRTEPPAVSLWPAVPHLQANLMGEVRVCRTSWSIERTSHDKNAARRATHHDDERDNSLDDKASCLAPPSCPNPPEASVWKMTATIAHAFSG